MYTIGMIIQQVHVNTKFLNALQPEWSKFVTDVKLAKNLYTTNYYQLYAYLSQHEGHANEARLLRERYPDPLALVANYHTQSHYAHTTSSTQYQHPFQTQLNHTTLTVPQNACDTPLISQQPQAEFPQLDSGLVVPSFLPEHLPIQETKLPFKMAGLLFNKFKGDRVVRGLLEQLAFLANLGVADGQDTQTTITHNASFQTDDLDAYDSDYDDISSAKAILMANLSSYSSDVLSE
ncbi:hypothetical protein Tco_1552151, partial [Tanacetum coccineum]